MLVTRDHLVTGGILYMVVEGPMSWGLARLAKSLERQDEAAEHYEHALEVTRRTGGRPAHALIALEYARHLAEVDEPARPTRGLELARLAKSAAEELGMHALRADAERLVAELPENAPSKSPEPPEPQALTMTQAGDSWVVCYGNVEFHLKDVRGVRMLATLVNEAGREFHALDLNQGPKAFAASVDRGDSGEVLDEEARRQYRSRVQELREELEEAESWNDPARAERTRQELAFIEQELSQAVGLGGRERRVGSAAERACAR